MKPILQKNALYIMVMILGIVIHSECVPAASAPSDLDLDEILKRVEDRYDVADFIVSFFQTSTLKAMKVQDTASGKLLVKRPGNMRWDYETPDRQSIISNGTQLWIYQPDDNQVLLGKSPAFFGEGKGAGFLSDFKSVRKSFFVSLVQKEGDNAYRLKLIPKQLTQDLSRVLLVVSPDTFEVKEVITYNAYDDETRIELKGYSYDQNLADDVFWFDIPDGVDIVKLDQ